LDDKFKAAFIEKIPLKRFGLPKDVANAAAFLLSDEAAYITGETLKVNGGIYM
jgi:3-oxoacyl-[acyl-carrier protein] reductase